MLTKKEEITLTREISRQNKCGSCGKHFRVSDIIEEEFCRQVNNGLIRNAKVGEIIMNILIDNCKSFEDKLAGDKLT